MRGIDKSQEIDPSQLLRDTRTLSQRISDFFSNSLNVIILLLACACNIFVLPVSVLFIFILGIIMFAYTYTKHQVLPFRMPKVTEAKDYNDLKPGIGQPNIARGIAFFGNDRKTNEELWFSNDDLRTHVLIFGSTGSGKTETLISLSFNALVQGSGFIYVDGKGDNALYAKVFSMVRGMGREDDLLIINFMTGARDIIGPQERRLSNTMNPFCQGSSSMLTQLIVNLMGNSKDGGDGDMWKGRAISFVEALMRILVYMRDEGAILLDANSIRNYFELTKLEAIVVDKVFPRDDQESVNIETVPKVVTDPLRNYVINLPGYAKDKKGKQVSQVLEQHGFITMQLTRAFSSLADTYGHILRTNLAEVDFKDVVLNRRILVVLLPALEKSPDELSNLGKIIVSSLKCMMAAGLGEDVEGEYRDVIERKVTTSPTPFLCVLDEYGYYAVQGFAVVPAQARSLGFSIIFAGQDLPAFQKASKEEAASIGANTNIKICMKLEDPTETWDFFTKTAGEAYVTKVDSFQTNETSISNTYKDSKSSSFEKRARVDLLDLKDQAEGEFHIFFKSRIVRGRAFFANPKPVTKLKINQFLKIESPQDEYLAKLEKQLTGFMKILESQDLTITNEVENEEITQIKTRLAEIEAEDEIEKAVSALIAYHNVLEPEMTEEEVEAFHSEEEPGVITIFTPLVHPETAPKLLVDDIDKFSEPILRIQQVRQYFIGIERLVGANDKLAVTIGDELLKDVKAATRYPPDERDHITVPELTEVVVDLINGIKAERNSG
ncbi:MAG: phosphoesterase [Gammaproteobacteria bacterium RIFCSPHIGHO2_12_FULL_41_15]|nr:MAG: phosphoesterase [Gammaproteobacteria bacterium RIFCSPHIGHO2_12_FULL_41_15]